MGMSRHTSCEIQFMYSKPVNVVSFLLQQFDCSIVQYVDILAIRNNTTANRNNME